MKKTFSIIAGRVSTEDNARVLELIDSLRAQTGDHTCEVILADRRNDAISRRVAEAYPEITLIPCEPDATLPELRTRALERATGEFVIVTEDHCVPPPDWLASISEAFERAPRGTVAVGGCVENGVCDTALDWATFICEYAMFVRPVAEGPTHSLPGMNVAYRRDALLGMERGRLTEGFWETTVHPELLARGSILFSSNAIRIDHRKKFSFRLFATQRFIYSRYYAGLRFPRHAYARRAAGFVASLALPPLLLLRMTRNLWAKRRLRREYLRALPYLTVFLVIWAAGEMAGYLAGTGPALRQIE